MRFEIESMQDKLQYLAGQPSGYIDTLPKKVKRRVTVLQEIQVGIFLHDISRPKVFWILTHISSNAVRPIFNICLVITYALNNGGEGAYKYEVIDQLNFVVWQSVHDELEAKFHEERTALEAKYQKLYEPLYIKVCLSFWEPS